MQKEVKKVFSPRARWFSLALTPDPGSIPRGPHCLEIIFIFHFIPAHLQAMNAFFFIRFYSIFLFICLTINIFYIHPYAVATFHNCFMPNRILRYENKNSEFAKWTFTNHFSKNKRYYFLIEYLQFSIL